MKISAIYSYFGRGLNCKNKGICLESRYPCDDMFFRLYLDLLQASVFPNAMWFIVSRHLGNLCTVRGEIQVISQLSLKDERVTSVPVLTDRQAVPIFYWSYVEAVSIGFSGSIYHSKDVRKIRFWVKVIRTCVCFFPHWLQENKLSPKDAFHTPSCTMPKHVKHLILQIYSVNEKLDSLKKWVHRENRTHRLTRTTADYGSQREFRVEHRPCKYHKQVSVTETSNSLSKYGVLPCYIGTSTVHGFNS